MGTEYIYLSSAMHELVDVSELLKQVYSIDLKYSEVHTKYRTISKTFGTINQSIVHEDNIAYLKFSTFLRCIL